MCLACLVTFVGIITFGNLIKTDPLCLHNPIKDLQAAGVYIRHHLEERLISFTSGVIWSTREKMLVWINISLIEFVLLR